MSFLPRSRRSFHAVAVAAIVAATGFASLAPAVAHAKDVTLLNVSYDPTRELYQEYNAAFAKYWKAKTGDNVTVKASHGGSGKQARSVIDGLEADVVTLALAYDIDAIAEKGLLKADWQKDFKGNSAPYTSTIVFLVRKGNPKQIENWDDLARDDVSLVFPNPKTSGNGRYTYLAAWGYADQAFDGDEAKIEDYMSTFLGNVEVFDTGGRGATTTFVERGIGDVLITFESEVNNIRNEYGKDDYEVVVPPVSILAELPVAVVDEYAERNGNEDLAKGYLDYLYTEEAQRLLAGFNYRVNDEKVAEEFSDQFPKTELLRVEDVFGSWPEAMETHFASGGELDQLQRR